MPIQIFTVFFAGGMYR